MSHRKDRLYPTFDQPPSILESVNTHDTPYPYQSDYSLRPSEMEIEDSDEQKPNKLAPNVFGAFIMGLLVLASFVGFIIFTIYFSDSRVDSFSSHFPLTTISLAHGLHWLVSVVSIIVKCCFKGCTARHEKTTIPHYSWAFVTEVCFVGTILLVWYLWQYQDFCSGERNQCVVIFTLDTILLVLFTIPWHTERADWGMVIFAFILSVTTGLVLWDSATAWDWHVFNVNNWEPFVVVSGITIMLALTAMSARKSMSHIDGSLTHLLFAHVSFGFVFVSMAAAGLEMYPLWTKLKYELEMFTPAIAWRYIAIFSIFAVFIFSLKSLGRFSDALTTHYTFKLSILMPAVVQFFLAAINKNFSHDWKNIIEAEPVNTAGVIAFLLAFIYWFIRIFTLGCCHKKQHGRHHSHDSH